MSHRLFLVVACLLPGAAAIQQACDLPATPKTVAWIPKAIFTKPPR